MSQTAEELLAAVRALPDEERASVIDSLLEESGDMPFDPAWLPILEKRSALFDAGAFRGKTVAELRDSLRTAGLLHD